MLSNNPNIVFSVTSLGSRSVSTPTHEPKDWKNALKKLDQGNVTVKCDHGKLSSNMGQLHSP